MNLDYFYDYCLSKKGVTEHFPFDEDTLVFKVAGKMFCLASLKDWENGNPTVNLKCDPDEALALRDIFPAILPGYHMNKKHWNTLDLTGDLPQSEVFKQIDHSYALIVKKLPKAVKQRLRIQHESLAWLS